VDFGLQFIVELYNLDTNSLRKVVSIWRWPRCAASGATRMQS